MPVPSEHYKVSVFSSRITLIRQAYNVWGVIFLEEKDLIVKTIYNYTL